MKKLSKKRFNLIVSVLAVFVGAALLIPLYPIVETTPAGIVNTVEFFEKIQTHLGSYWMFYAIILALLKFMPKKVARKNPFSKKQIKYFFSFVVLFILASLFVPIVGAAEGAAAWWVNTVDFFTKTGNHIQSFWMFYTVIFAILLYKRK